LGLLSDEPFPLEGGPWETWPARPAVPSGPAADAHFGVGPAGLDLSPVLGDEDAGAEAPKPIERFRYMEIQGEVIKVRCVPLWQSRMLGMLDGADEDDKAQERLVRAVRHHAPSIRVRVVSFLMTQLQQEGRGGGPTAGRLAEIKLPANEAGNSEAPGEGALPAVQRGRSVLNG
jgi:hypothetical protein